MGALERGGVLLRFGGGLEEAPALAFIPADVAARLVTLSAITPVPGARPPVAGIALADGAVVTVLELGRASPPSYRPGDDWPVPGSNRAVLCDLDGLGVAITGGTVLTTGLFDTAPGEDGVLWRGEVVPVLDVRGLYAQAEAAIWAERAVTSQPAGPRQRGPSGPRQRGPSGPQPLLLEDGSVAEEPDALGDRVAIAPTPPSGFAITERMRRGGGTGGER